MEMTAPQIDMTDVDLEMLLQEAIKDDMNPAELTSRLVAIAEERYETFAATRDRLKGCLVKALAELTLTSTEVNQTSRELRDFLGLKIES